LWIADDIFGLKPGWIEEFAALATARDASVPFKCLMRADQVDRMVASALAAARCQVVWIGAESGSQRILDAMEKGTRVEQIYQTTKLLHEAGINVGFFLQFGYPGETREDIDLTLRMVRDCRPDDIGVSVSYPLPGTPFYDRVRSELGEKRNWVDSDDLAAMYRAPYVPDFYRALHAAVHAEFRLRKRAPALGRFVRRPWTVRLAHLRQAGALVYYAVKLPLLRQRLDSLARLQSVAPRALLPVLSAHEAAVPTRQDC
jgi:anaerobic magnesium-protoporphyrin IX monomethyl ester cyclase